MVEKALCCLTIATILPTPLVFPKPNYIQLIIVYELMMDNDYHLSL